MFGLRTCLALVFVSTPLTAVVSACPFCSPISQTFSQEMEMMDVVVIARFKSRARTSTIDSRNPQMEVPKSAFEVTNVIKGKEHIDVGDTFKTIYLETPKKHDVLLAMATDAPNLVWSTPLVLTDQAQDYLGKLRDLPSGPERLEFFLDYMEDEDEMLARDTYDEFARAPYADLIQLKPKMNRRRLLEFIDDLDVPRHRRKLYFTMLGICGTQEDVKLLETLMSSKDRESKSGLDAMLACYLILAGEEGLEKVDELFLKNGDAEYVDTNAAITAIRFHGTEIDVLPRKRLAQSLRHVLDRPELADLVVPDLALLQDWDVLPKLCELFIKADENSSWVRAPIIRYLRACPLPIAKDKIEELKLIDADAVKYAMIDVDASGGETKTPPQPDGPVALNPDPPPTPRDNPEVKSIAHPWLILLPCLIVVVVVTAILANRKRIRLQ